MDDNNRTVATMLDVLIRVRRERGIEQGEAGAAEASPEYFLTWEEREKWEEVRGLLEIE